MVTKPRKGPKAVINMAIVWPCRLDVEQYVETGQELDVPRMKCPACGAPMIFWSGYLRFVRLLGDSHHIFLHRMKCKPCRTSHAVIPAFLLIKRLDPVQVIGAALVRSQEKEGMRPIAKDLLVPLTTARDWRRRFRERAPELAAHFQSLAVELGAPPDFSTDSKAAFFEALNAACQETMRRLKVVSLSPWRFASMVTGSLLLATTTIPLFQGYG